MSKSHQRNYPKQENRRKHQERLYFDHSSSISVTIGGRFSQVKSIGIYDNLDSKEIVNNSYEERKQSIDAFSHTTYEDEYDFDNIDPVYQDKRPSCTTQASCRSNARKGLTVKTKCIN